MTDERLKEIRESNAKQRRFMEWNCRGQYINERHVVTHVEELIAEIERLRADAARLDRIGKSYSYIKSAYDLMYESDLTLREAFDKVMEAN